MYIYKRTLFASTQIRFRPLGIAYISNELSFQYVHMHIRTMNSIAVILTMTTQGCPDDLIGGSAIADNPYSIDPVNNDCELVDVESRITREEFNRITHLAKQQTTSAMRSVLPLPYCFIGSTEYYPLATDESTWIGIKYDPGGQYIDYTISAENQLIPLQ